jgi:hypothetical protein
MQVLLGKWRCGAELSGEVEKAIDKCEYLVMPE